MTSSHVFGVLGQCSTLYLSEDSVRVSPWSDERRAALCTAEHVLFVSVHTRYVLALWLVCVNVCECVCMCQEECRSPKFLSLSRLKCFVKSSTKARKAYTYRHMILFMRVLKEKAISLARF